MLDRARLASPCTARWEDMSGDDRTRFCPHCQKHVFNLSAMSQAEAEKLVREKEGSFCGRFYKRGDGRILNGNCPVGQRRRRTRVKKFCAMGLAALALFSTAWAAGGGQRRKGPPGPLAQKIDGWIYDAKVKLGLIEPVMILGKIAPPLPPPTSSTNRTGK